MIVQDHTEAGSPRPRPPRTLLIASTGLGVLALAGFIVSAVAFNSGSKAPLNRDATDATTEPTPALEGQGLANSVRGILLAGLSLSFDGEQALGPSGYGLAICKLNGDGRSIRRVGSQGRRMTFGFFLPGDREALVGRFEGGIDVIDLATGATARSFAGKISAPRLMALSADGRRAFANGNGKGDKLLREWDVESGQELKLVVLPQIFQQLSVSSDGSRALLGQRGLYLWEPDKQTPLRPLSSPKDLLGSSALSPDGRNAVFSIGARLTLWDVDSDREIESFEMSQSPARVVFGRDGRTILAGSGRAPVTSPVRDSLVWLIDLDGRQVHEFTGHPGGVAHLALSPDGKRAVTVGAADFSLHVWQLPARP